MSPDDDDFLPAPLLRGYRDWRGGMSASERERARHLAAHGQRPTAMIVACCDSRVQPEAMFGAGPGVAFVHRNIAALVPAWPAFGEGTAAAVSYAVVTLGITDLVVLGHSGCGGVAGCAAMYAGAAPDLAAPDSPVGRWLDHMRPAIAEVTAAGEPEDPAALERAAVRLSLINLATHPAVAEATAAGHLRLHGLRLDIGEGVLEDCAASRRGAASG